MDRKLSFAFISLLLLAMMFSANAAGENASDSKDIDIDSSITIRMVFDEGERMSLHADIVATRDPISVVLLKGEGDYDRWKQSEDVDLQAIMDGEEPENNSTDYRVVENFSSSNITSFDRSIDIGEKDTYYLVIFCHREKGMTKEDVLTLGSSVRYDVTWEEESNDVPYYLIPVALILFIVGSILIILFFLWGKNDRKEPDNDNHKLPERPGRSNMHGRGHPSGQRTDTRRRVPPRR